MGGIPDDIFLHMFNTFDTDNSGSVGKSEFIAFINMLQNEEAVSQNNSLTIKNDE